MDTTREGPKPDETDSSAVRPPIEGRDQPDTEITKTYAGKATASHKPANEVNIPAEPEKDEEYVLEREPDGRYRIVARRPRKSN